MLAKIDEPLMRIWHPGEGRPQAEKQSTLAGHTSIPEYLEAERRYLAQASQKNENDTRRSNSANGQLYERVILGS